MKSNELINDLLTVAEITTLIEEGEYLLVAGDEKLLNELPEGNWIAGTSPYFMTPQGALTTRDKLFVTKLPSYFENIKIKSYDETNIDQVYNDGFDNGVSFIIIPSSSAVHLKFAVGAPNYENFATKPLIGWISGFHLDDMLTATPKVFNGFSSENSSNLAVVMHASLPPTKYAEINIINLFEQGNGDTVEFLEDGFVITDIVVNGAKRNFYEYLKEIKHDLKFPLVANYQGAMINVSYQRLDDEKKIVHLYTPVFRGMEYRHASKIKDYLTEYGKLMPKDDLDSISFSCNCILNYVYSELEGKTTEGVIGPFAFGEVAYQLLNQTLAYLTINNYSESDD